MPRLPKALALIGALLRAQPRGLAAVEFGLAAPFLILMLVGLVDFGMGFYSALQVQGAASAGAEYATVHGWDCTGMENSVSSASAINGVSGTAQPPQQVCGCTISGTFSNPTSGALTLATCPASPTASCGSSSSVCSNGSTAGTYAKVQAQYTYTPMLPYPWTKSPVTLSGTAYRRLQ